VCVRACTACRVSIHIHTYIYIYILNIHKTCACTCVCVRACIKYTYIHTYTHIYMNAAIRKRVYEERARARERDSERASERVRASWCHLIERLVTPSVQHVLHCLLKGRLPFCQGEAARSVTVMIGECLLQFPLPGSHVRERVCV
jgi:hypothetical protein